MKYIVLAFAFIFNVYSARKCTVLSERVDNNKDFHHFYLIIDGKKVSSHSTQGRTVKENISSLLSKVELNESKTDSYYYSSDFRYSFAFDTENPDQTSPYLIFYTMKGAQLALKTLIQAGHCYSSIRLNQLLIPSWIEYLNNQCADLLEKELSFFEKKFQYQDFLNKCVNKKKGQPESWRSFLSYIPPAKKYAINMGYAWP